MLPKLLKAFLSIRIRPHNRRIVLIMLCCIILTTLAWRSINLFSHQRPFTDSGVFTAVAHHFIHGKTLYREVWDHKPPMIYFIDAAAFSFISSDINAIRLVERGFAIITLLAFFFILYLLFNNLAIAFCMSIAFNTHFYIPEIFQGGNLTEEYAITFLILGILCTVLYQTNNKHAVWLYPFLSGCWFSFSSLTKEPFILSVIPWLLFLFIRSKTNSTAAPKILLYGVGGIALPLLGFIIYFFMINNLSDWMNVIIYNLHYAEYSHSSHSYFQSLSQHATAIYSLIIARFVVTHVLFWLGIGSAFFTSFIRRYHYVPLIVLAGLLIDLAAISLGGFDIEHYYLQIIPTFILTCTLGLVFMVDCFYRWNRSPLWFFSLVLLLFILFDGKPLKRYIHRISAPAGQAQPGPLANYMNKHAKENDTLWCGIGDHSKYYIETGLLSPTKYLYLFEHLIYAWPEKEQQKAIVDQVMNEIQTNPPTYIVLSFEDIQRLRKMGFNSLIDWIYRHYQKRDDIREGGTVLYINREKV